MNEINKLYSMVTSYYKYEQDRAFKEHRNVVYPEHVDFEYNKMKRIFEQTYKAKKENDERLVREVNRDGN